MQRLKDDNGYKIYKNDGYYNVIIASTEYGQYRHYEYSAGCATYEELEKYLQENDFKTVVEQFKKDYVYLECVEPL